MGVFYTAIFVSLFCTSFAAPQQPEINDQFQITDPVTEKQEVPDSSEPSTEQSTKQEHFTQPDTVDETVKALQTTVFEPKIKANVTQKQIITVNQPQEVGFTVRIYKFITEPIIKVVRLPKVHAVLRNIGTCVVNGAMEIFSYYLPAPFMPLIASAAGLIIPFEPVVMLKEKMPVTSYRRAFQTAINSFLGTFDKYKVEDDFDPDPYMTRRFNRRFAGDDDEKMESKRGKNRPVE